MIAISTIQKILYYKQKYSRIGQSSNETLQNDDAWGEFQKFFGKDGSLMVNELTKSLKKLNETVSAGNVGLSRFTSIQEEINTAVVSTVAEMTLLEDIESDLTSTFKVGTKELAIRSKAYSTIQNAIKATNDEMASYRATMEKTSELSGALFASEVNKKDKTQGLNTYIERQIVANQYLARNTDLTDDNAAALAEYAAGVGRSLDDQVMATDALASSYDGVIAKSTAFEIISKGIAELSADVRQQYGRIPGNLETAVLKSKMLGVSMAQLSKTGEELLDIESSVGKEIEYQLLSGKRLVDQQGKSITNQYRVATLNGDAVKQADLLKQVYITQKDVLSGNNILAKKALADSMGMTTQDLMAMYEKQKVQEQIVAAYEREGKIKGEQADIEKLLADPEKMKAFKITLEQSKSKDDKALLDSIKTLEEKQETRMSPAEKMEKNLQHIVDKGLKIKNIDELDKARTAAGTYGTEMQERTKVLQSKALQQTSGQKQLKRDFVNTATKQTAVMNQIPAGIGTTISDFTKKAADAYTKTFTGTDVAKARNKKIKADGRSKKINDGIIQFNDKDKLTVVASPFGTMNEKVADKITNPANSGGQSIDTNSIVSAIQSALGNINITVALDPMAIDKEIKFRQGSLNGKS